MIQERRLYSGNELYQQIVSTRNLFRELRETGFEGYLSQHADEIRKRLKIFEQDTPLVDVVVAVFNEQDFLLASIDALSRQTIPINIIVVDNGSKDATPTIISSLDLSVVTEPVRGIGSAKKAGILHTSAPRVLICDADTTPVPTWAEMLVSKLPNTSELKAVYCPMFYYDNDTFAITTYNLIALGGKFLRSKTAHPHYQGNSCGYTKAIRNLLIANENPQAGDDGPIHKAIMASGGHTEWIWHPYALAFTSSRRLKQHGVVNVLVRRAAHFLTGNSDVAYYTLYDANERGEKLLAKDGDGAGAEQNHS